MKTNDQNQKHKKNKISFKRILEVIKDEISKIISFKIKKNPALNQTEIIIRGETKMTDGIVKKTKAKTKKVPELHPEIKQFMEEQKKFNGDVKEFMQDQNKKWEQQAKVNHQMSEFIKDQNKKWEEQSKVNQAILTSIQEILLKIQRIEKCPTIKKELDELE